MTAILPFLGAALARLLANDLARWIALKGLLLGLMMTILPVVLNNLMHSWLQIGMTMIQTTIGETEIGAVTGTISSMGWLVALLKIPEIFSMFASAFAFRFALKLIPFVRT